MSRSLVRSSGIVGGFTLLSRILGFVREIMLARIFGAGGQMDVFLVVLMIPNFGRRVFAEGAFSQAFVPVFTETKTRGQLQDVRHLTSVVMGTLGGVLSVITLLGCLAAPWLIYVFAPGFRGDPHKFILSGQLLRWTFPYLMFISLTSMVAGILNIYGRFAIPAFTPVILNVCLIASAFIDERSVDILAYAVFLAGILQFSFQLPALVRLNLLPLPRWGWHDARVRQIVRLMGPVVVGSTVAQISLLLNTALSTFTGDGSVSWLQWASRLMEFPLGVISIAIGTATLPALSSHHATGSHEAFSDTLDWSLRTVMVFGLPAALGVIWLAGPIVATTYGHGRFGAHDIRMTAYALWAYGAGIMGFSLIKVLVPGFYSRGDNRPPVRCAITALVVGMLVNLVLFAFLRFVKFPAAHVGLAASTSLTAWINSLLLLRHLRRQGIYRPGEGWGGFLLKVAAANLAMSVLVLLLSGSLDGWIAQSAWHRAVRLTAIVAGAMAIYFATLFALGMRPRDFRARSRAAEAPASSPAETL
jgi:putative peptidoglycan lipid II flippase